MTVETPQVRIVEVGPRDGLQNIREKVPTSTKLELIQRLRDAGLRTIELTSVVSPRAIPQLADCREVLGHSSIKALIEHDQAGLRFPVLVPNVKGLEIAVQHGVREVAVFISATEGFSRANINCSVEQGIAKAREVARLANKASIAVRGYVSCIFADPFDGPTPEAAVLHCVKSLLDAGCYEVSLGDTLGVGSPANVHRLIQHLTSHGVPIEKLAGHFHDTYGQAVANVWEAYRCGMRVFDSSVGGLGGCPYAPGAKGNVASEDLVYMFQNAGISTGVDLAKLVQTGEWISQQLSQSNSSRAGKALSIKSQPTEKSAATNIKSLAPSAKDTPLLEWTLTSSPEGLHVHRNGTNLKITLNRPKNGNALTSTMLTTLTETIQSANTDPQTTRIIITATGRFFCTGMDLGKGTSPVARGGSASDAQFARLTALFEAIDASPKVTIAAMNGPAFGGGVGLAFACDIRLCSSSAACTLSEVKLGLTPATISKYVVREWGVPFAREAMLSARSVGAEELAARGLVSAVGDLERLLDALLIRLKGSSPGGSRMSKELVKLGWVHGGRESQASGIRELFDEMMRADGEGAIGLMEFQAGRKMDWDAFVLGQGQEKAKL
ncbi:Hydroxymethylglutaryl-CoA lyase [Penicillium rolfsii]|nr:Hydroxymethylglutaryl-CoA lyase [Penicillium rolfsii]